LFLDAIVKNWQVYVDQSKPSLDRGASTTLDTFCSLCPPSKVQVIAAILPKSNKKTPWVRCISKIPGRSSIDIANVDSVDKVYRILTKHMQIQVGRGDFGFFLLLGIRHSKLSSPRTDSIITLALVG
jgi:hypothetical protein